MQTLLALTGGLAVALASLIMLMWLIDGVLCVYGRLKEGWLWR